MSQRLPRLPIVLLSVLTLLTGAGPFAIAMTLRGGSNAHWPPDRPLEWWTFGLVIATFVAVMAACMSIGLANWRRTVRENATKKSRPAPEN